MPRPRDDDDGEDAPPQIAKVWSRRGDGETMPKETIKHKLPPRDGPAPTVGSRQNFESRAARRMAGKDSTQGPYTPPLAFDNRVKVHKGDQGGGRKSFFLRYEEPKEPTEEEAAKNYDDLIDKLRARLGHEHVATEASAGRTAFREEWGGTLDATVAVVRPVSMQEVADVLRLCVDIGMPVSPGEDPDDARERGPASATNRAGAAHVPEHAAARDPGWTTGQSRQKIGVEDKGGSAGDRQRARRIILGMTGGAAPPSAPAPRKAAIAQAPDGDLRVALEARDLGDDVIGLRIHNRRRHHHHPGRVRRASSFWSRHVGRARKFTKLVLAPRA